MTKCKSPYTIIKIGHSSKSEYTIVTCGMITHSAYHAATKIYTDFGVECKLINVVCLSTDIDDLLEGRCFLFYNENPKFYRRF